MTTKQRDKASRKPKMKDTSELSWARAVQVTRREKETKEKHMVTFDSSFFASSSDKG